VQLSTKITYQLWAGDGLDRVSRLLCNYRAVSRMRYRRAMGEMESVCGCAAIETYHVLSVGGRWERGSQCVILKPSSDITYLLWADNGRDEISGLLCSYLARSSTVCGRVMGETESVGSCAAIQRDHVLPVGKRCERQSQPMAVQLSSKITYSLWSGDVRDGVSGWLCSY
jgi:hypothetical protein